MILVIDLETVPDRTLYTPPPVVAGEESEFPPPWAHRVVVIGALSLTDEWVPTKLGAMGAVDDEPLALTTFAKALAVSKNPQLVTWNGRGFDLPVIEARSMRHGIAQPNLLSRDVRDRYRGERHVDAKDFASNFGAACGYHLGDIARLIGLPGKIGVDGSQVDAMYAAGKLDEIVRYCLSDVVQTMFVRFRQLLLLGMALDKYQEVASGLLEFVEKDGRLSDLLAGIDRERLLLTAAPTAKPAPAQASVPASATTSAPVALPTPAPAPAPILASVPAPVAEPARAIAAAPPQAVSVTAPGPRDWTQEIAAATTEVQLDAIRHAMKAGHEGGKVPRALVDTWKAREKALSMAGSVRLATEIQTAATATGA